MNNHKYDMINDYIEDGNSIEGGMTIHREGGDRGKVGYWQFLHCCGRWPASSFPAMKLEVRLDLEDVRLAVKRSPLAATITTDLRISHHDPRRPPMTESGAAFC
jgi:hypothetical protein